MSYTESTTHFTHTAAGNNFGIITINVEPHATPFLHQQACETVFSQNDTLAGLPAHNEPGMWIIDTQVARYQINYDPTGHFWHGIVMPVHSGFTAPTALPAAIIERNQREITQILSTFRPQSSSPLQC